MSSPMLLNVILFWQADAGTSPIGFFGMMIAMFAIFYFLLIRPQQKRVKEHKDMVGGLSRNDTVVTAGGIIGKVTKVTPDNEEVTVEIATGVKVKVLRSTLQDVRSKNSPKPANDAPAKKANQKK
ncbi:Protein translocase subunit YajC [hydrothermal vent metagenome]|uniref:Protein translocase subunit YajC n=1 Tax=hydrothermal vent metagenome TaxID=652676 RepID=A0A3B0S0H1_9ZZZZ